MLGLDLSLTSAGLCLLPATWAADGCDWSAAKLHTVALDLSARTALERAQRIELISQDVFRFLMDHVPPRATVHCFCEGYSFGSKHRAHHLGELGGHMRVAMHYMWCKDMQTQLHDDVAPASWRRVLLGKNPPRDAKKIAHAALCDVGCPHKTGDEADAFGVANFGLTELGMPCLTVATG